ncbi:MAG: zinc metallopeptidase [Acidobacteriota bacterium]
MGGYIFLVMLPALVLSGIASWMTRSAFKKYSQVRASSGLTGAQAAQRLLSQAGITDVEIVPHQGTLSDHYNPMTKRLALSEPVYGSTSVAAIGVACHEAGHAIQHAKSYPPLWVRSALVPTANFGGSFGGIVVMAGLLFQIPSLMLFGCALFGAVLLFQLITLPVEFDASARAKKLALAHGLVSESEQKGMNRVLNAAALTYVAAMVGTLLTLLYYLSLALGRRD